ncbi:MAG: tRNA (guanosine(37)-N1)-methyltransferase TrmD [Dissulfurimicrobium sp.]|uniref:tRNA (guanosine(37)-N1)-methyltransferase TrmD n=1 Tax=Dissulfurimicrobium TaxID=1769732 RepID=UPI001EDA4A95|nr:tRNA (guanosine(37)-N1)-methyltransferase TrmD [Dissulfurimicrobium hydrothermale]UKL13423.1 tRNA (guanosine(37)-N1)-methyltransferase TrmD [Dissulfurimicrobium hydrothermale]
MLFDILTIFPEFFSSPLREGVLGRAIERGIVKVRIVNLRDFALDRHRTVDDRPYGGGEGMVLKPEPIFRAVKMLRSEPPLPKVLLLSPRGRVLDHAFACELADMERLVFICGRYEGVDERIHRCLADIELSIGDYILSGGEPAALVVIDVLSRLIPGVLGCETSACKDSFSDGLLEYPQYTRPLEYMGIKTPEVLISGDHARIARWRREQSLALTMEKRPDMLAKARLNEEDMVFLNKIGWRGR